MQCVKECFGELLPDLSELRGGEPCRGKALAVNLRRRGGTFLEGERIEIRTDRAAWDECHECPDYGSCYDLSLAKLLLRSALNNARAN